MWAIMKHNKGVIFQTIMLKATKPKNWSTELSIPGWWGHEMFILWVTLGEGVLLEQCVRETQLLTVL